VEEDKSLEEILAMGFEKKVVKEAIRLVDKNE